MKSTQSPFLTHFLSDFTLGFSDGLTVPFALTAGLSSLGRTDTVISGGLAELCAGSISMGIGGYLAARDETPKNSQYDESHDEEELRGMLQSSGSVVEKFNDSAEEVIRHHLEPLDLSEAVISKMMAVLQDQPEELKQAVRQLQSRLEAPLPQTTPIHVSPVVSGLSISLGYVVGGVIPLFPYFFFPTIETGLRWSIGLCLLALFVFGSGKSWVLRGLEEKRWRRCLWEGTQMLVLGTLAAGAAVICVRLVGGDVEEGG